MNIEYVGEHLLIGQIGHLFVITAFVAALISFISFWKAQNNKQESGSNGWEKAGNIAFIIQSLAIFSLMGILYYLIFTHKIEYEYVRAHSAHGMPLKYLISCFWAGQQGSFILWIFWHSVLGLLFMKTMDKKWSIPVLAVISIVQVIIISMILGVFMYRGIAIVLLFLGLNMFFWKLLEKYGQAGWKSLIPVYNIITLFKLKKKPNALWLLFLLALPVNIILLILLPLHGLSFFYFFSDTIQIGFSPFLLTRQLYPENPLFLNPDYINMMAGMGLNPLLENYWMVIHPPTLFLGFASTIIPFSLVYAGFWNRDLTGWTKPAMPWTVFSGLILGTGIIMGGLWAYESLSFGGFWAWDPVENASFVPWLTLIAGLHALLIYKHSKHALRTTYVMFIITFFLVLYSTFLTRSGILGDSSVHAFTDLGMMGQLIILIIALILPALILLAEHWKQIPSEKKEEKTSSREFWMFIGSLILLISATQITFTTSIPVLNSINSGLTSIFPFLSGFHLLGVEIFKSNYAPPQDAEAFYNSIQVWFGILIALLSGIVQFLKYKKTDIGILIKKISIPLILALVLTVLILWAEHETRTQFVLLQFAGFFSLIANLDYLIFAMKGKLRLGGASIAHLGFGLLLASLVITLANNKIISRNFSGQAISESMPADFNRNNIKFDRGQLAIMGDYAVSYSGRMKEGNNYYYSIDYFNIDSLNQKFIPSFTLKPHVLDHPRMGIVVNPATKHFWNKDIFTHVTAVPLDKEGHVLNEAKIESYEVGIGDTIQTSTGRLIFHAFYPNDESDTVIKVTTDLSLFTADSIYQLSPSLFIGQTQTWGSADSLTVGSFKIAVTNINPENGKFTFNILETTDWVIMKAIVFPFIILLWSGIVLTILGFFISLANRIKEFRSIAKREKT